MTVRRGLLYLGVFLLAAGAVTLAGAAGLIDPDAVADAAMTMWPLAVIAIGVALVLRRSSAALAAGILAAMVPGLALGVTVVAASSMPAPWTTGLCADPGTRAGAPEIREGSFAGPASVSLDLACGEASVGVQPGTSWRVGTRDGAHRSTNVRPTGTQLFVGEASGRVSPPAGSVGWDVALPADTQLDLTTSVSAGRASLDLGGAALGAFDLTVSAADARADLTGASLQRMGVEVSAGSASIVLPAAAFTGNVTVSAGSAELCVPAGLSLRVHGSAALGDIDTDGLIRREDAWESPGNTTSTARADLTIEASLGSVTIKPEGACK